MGHVEVATAMGYPTTEYSLTTCRFALAAARNSTPCGKRGRPLPHRCRALRMPLKPPCIPWCRTTRHRRPLDVVLHERHCRAIKPIFATLRDEAARPTPSSVEPLLVESRNSGWTSVSSVTARFATCPPSAVCTNLPAFRRRREFRPGCTRPLDNGLLQRTHPSGVAVPRAPGWCAGWSAVVRWSALV